MELSILQIGNKIESEIRVTNYNQHCAGWQGIYREGSFFVKTKSNNSILIDQNRIKCLKVFIEGTKNYSLDKDQYLKSISLSSIKEIFIFERSNVSLKINLHNWPNRKYINNDSLLTFEVDGYNVIDTALAAGLKDFVNLRRLQLPFCVNSELLQLKNLESVLLRNSVYFFANNLICIDGLKDYNSKDDGILEFQRSSLSAQTQFLFENLSIESGDHLIYVIDSLLKLKKLDKLKANGDVFLLANEVFNWVGNDTVAQGKIINEKKVGIWKYALSPEHPYYYNFDSTHGCASANFPDNGIWQYKYPNGKIGIEGRFKNRKKEGIWKFYDLNGNLSSQKEFNADQPKGLFIDYEEGKQIRKYFFNQFTYIAEISEKEKTIYYTVKYGNDGNKYKYSSGPNGDFYLFKNDKLIKHIKKNSSEYKKILNNNFLKYLYAK